ncbi:MAG TPA: hypothetical protein VMF29_08775 [Candidatus Edwardsbacteria bacterium]|nr:hypothetical protein [Candidatus Edwardsbacteria bacterium]
MRRTIVMLALLPCCCAPGLQRSGPGGQPRPVAGVAETAATLDDGIAVGSLWLDRYANVYCTDRAKLRLVSLGPAAGRDGEPAEFRFERPLDDPNSFLVPGYDGGYCLADNIGHQLVFSSYQGRQSAALPLGGRTATAAAMDAAGDIYVLDGSDRSVQVYDQRGAVLRRFTLAREPQSPGFAPVLMAVAPSAQLLAVADPAASVVQCYSSFGRYAGSAPLRAAALAFDRSDRLWSVDSSGRISVQAWRGARWQTLWQGQQALPGAVGGIAAGPGEGVTIAAGNRLIICR